MNEQAIENTNKEIISSENEVKDTPAKEHSAQNKFEIDTEILNNPEEREKVIEAIIYVEGNVPVNRLKSIFNLDNGVLSEHINNINNKYKNANSIIEVLEVGDSFMMTVSPSVFGTLSAIYDRKKKKKISKAVLQTLSIIAYKQPLTKAEIDDIRQSDSAYHLRTLMEDGFIEWKGRKDYLDKRQTFGTTDKFLIHFGVNSLDDLPKLRELKDLEFNKNE